MKKKNLPAMIVVMLMVFSIMPVLMLKVYAETDTVRSTGGEVIDGASFVGALGGDEYASYSEADGIYTVTLNGNTELTDYIIIRSGNFILQGSGTITRAEGYTGTLIKTDSVASLTLGGDVIVDGGAVWKKDGQPSLPSEDAENTGITGTGALIYSNGTLTLTENADHIRMQQ